MLGGGSCRSTRDMALLSLMDILDSDMPLNRCATTHAVHPCRSQLSPFLLQSQRREFFFRMRNFWTFNMQGAAT
jgi:hypothetical protein